MRPKQSRVPPGSYFSLESVEFPVFDGAMHENVTFCEFPCRSLEMLNSHASPISFFLTV